MLITIGLVIIGTGIGLFAWKFFKSSSNGGPSMFEEWVKEKREQSRINKEFKLEQQKVFNEARREALQELKPSMTQFIKEQELEKLKKANEPKTDKLKKFAEAFSLKGTGIGSDDKINQMLGKDNSGRSNNYTAGNKLNNDYDSMINKEFQYNPNMEQKLHQNVPNLNFNFSPTYGDYPEEREVRQNHRNKKPNKFKQQNNQQRQKPLPVKDYDVEAKLKEMLR